VDSWETNPQFEVICQDQTFLDINDTLRQRWEAEKIPWIDIGATIFDIRPTVNSQATAATVALLDIEF
jgi:hypothetical protein